MPKSGLRRWSVRAVAALGLLFLALQLVPVRRDNPEPRSALAAPPEVDSVLRRSCYDCHSFETSWPWYSYVAPASWLVARDVRRGRVQLNFSNWGVLDAMELKEAAEDVDDVLAKGEMPLRIYLVAHPRARLSAQNVATLRAWANGVERDARRRAHDLTLEDDWGGGDSD